VSDFCEQKLSDEKLAGVCGHPSRCNCYKVQLPGRTIVSFSGGKDSTAMLLRMVELDYEIDEIVFFDTGWEFPAMYEHIEQVEKYIGRKITRLHPKHSFDELLVRYGWPKPFARWCTCRKADALKKKQWRGNHYVGIAIDERHRIGKNKNGYIHPLVEWGWTEADCLDYCRSKGFAWGGLYNHFTRVSCFCCPLQSVYGAESLYRNYPQLWKRLKEMDQKSKHDWMANYVNVDALENMFENQLSLWGKAIESC